MRNSATLLLIFVLFPFFSQKNTCISEDKKLIKLVQTLKDESNYEAATALFKEANKLFPDNAELPYVMANKAIQQSKNLANKNNADSYVQQALVLYNLSYKKCKTFHAESIYFLASYYLNKGELEKAIPLLKEYIDFPKDDFTRISSDYDTKVKNAGYLVKKYETKQQFIENAVPFSPYPILNVSSELDEYFPMLSPDNDLLFFTRKVNRKNLGDILDNIKEEFTVAERENESINTFTYGDPLRSPFNTPAFYNYGTASLSADNKEMVICACKKDTINDKPYLNCDLYTTTYKRSGKGGNDFQWTPLKNMGSGINTPDGWEAQPSLSADGKMLFYATYRRGSQNNDIYYSLRKDDGTWSEGQPFTEINTAGKDKSPFFHQDGETLYFVSECTDSREGLGGLDIFYIRKTKDGWTKPENIGYPINTEGDELGIFVSTQGKIAYYSSYQNNNWNIYGFQLHEKAQPKPVIIVKGSLTDENEKPVTDGSVELVYGSSGEKVNVAVNKEDGKYAAVVKINKDEPVVVNLKKEGAAFNSKIITEENLKSNSVAVDLTVEKVKTGKPYNINDILFESDSYALNASAKLILDQFASYLKENTSYKVAIHGHTDDLGDDMANLKLSQDRAKSVAQYIINQGIAANRISHSGFGEKQPKFPNQTDEQRRKNRRTEFLLIGL